MTSWQLAELRGFLENYYEEFQEYLGTGDPTLTPAELKEIRIAEGAHEAQAVYDALCEAISFTEELGI